MLPHVLQRSFAAFWKIKILQMPYETPDFGRGRKMTTVSKNNNQWTNTTIGTS